MDRLTWRDENGRAWFSMKINDGYWGRRSAAISDAVSERLAAYEETGLTPEEVRALAVMTVNNSVKNCFTCCHNGQETELCGKCFRRKKEDWSEWDAWEPIEPWPSEYPSVREQP